LKSEQIITPDIVHCRKKLRFWFGLWPSSFWGEVFKDGETQATDDVKFHVASEMITPLKNTKINAPIIQVRAWE
jgi:hypothetical protein